MINTSSVSSSKTWSRVKTDAWMDVLRKMRDSSWNSASIHSFFGLHPTLVREKDNDESRTLLHHAAKNGCQKMVGFLVENFPDLIDYKDRKNFTALHIAAENGQQKVAEFLIQADPKLVDAKAKSGKTALHVAIDHRKYHFVKFLIQVDPHLVEAVTNNGRTALHLAVLTGWDKMVQLVLKATPEGATKLVEIRESHQKNWEILHNLIDGDGVRQIETLLNSDPNMFDEDVETNALYYAAISGKAEIIELLLKKKPELFDNIDIYQWDLTVLFSMRKTQDIERAVELLLLHNSELVRVSITNYGWSIMHEACKEGYVTVVRLLLKLQPEAIDSVGSADDEESALQLAVKNGHLNVVRLLLELKPELLDFESFQNSSLLHLAVSKHCNEEMIQFLLQAKPSLINFTDVYGSTALHIAVRRTNARVVKCLLQASPALINAVNLKGSTALHAAISCREQNDEVVFFLVKASPTLLIADAKGETLLHRAVSAGRIGILDLLVNAVPQLLDAVDCEGNTVLHHAAMNSQDHIVESLLKIKPDLADVRNNDGKLAIGFALSEHSDSIVESLLMFKPALINEYGQRIFCLAAEKGNQSLIEYLLRVKPELIDSQIGSALSLAAKHGNFELLEFLLKYKPGLIDCGREIIFLVVRNYRLLDLMLKLNPLLINVNNGVTGESLLHVAVAEADISVVQLLLAASPMLVNSIDKYGKSSAHWAAYHGERQALELMLQIKPELIDEVDFDGRNILHFNIMGGDIGEIAKWLLTLKPKLIDAADQGGKTPLHLATNCATDTMLRTLCVSSHQSFDHVIDAVIGRRFNFSVIAAELIAEHCVTLLRYLSSDIGQLVYEYLVDSKIIVSGDILELQQNSLRADREAKKNQHNDSTRNENFAKRQKL